MMAISKDKANLKKLTAPITVFKDASDTQASRNEPQLRRFLTQQPQPPFSGLFAPIEPRRVTEEADGSFLSEPKKRALITYSRKNVTAPPSPLRRSYGENFRSGSTNTRSGTPETQQTPQKRRRLPDIGGLTLVPALDDLNVDDNVSGLINYV